MAFDPGEDSIWPDWWRPAVMAELLELSPACTQDVWGWIQSGLCPRASSPRPPRAAGSPASSKLLPGQKVKSDSNRSATCAAAKLYIICKVSVIVSVRSRLQIDQRIFGFSLFF